MFFVFKIKVYNRPPSFDTILLEKAKSLRTNGPGQRLFLKFQKKFIFVIVFLSVGLHSAQQMQNSATADTVENKKTLFQLIAQENLKTLTTNALENTNGFSSMIKDFDDQGFDKVAQKKFEQQMHPNLHDRRKLVLNLLSEHEKKQKQFIESVLDFGSVSDLELLCGPKSNNSFYLAGILDRTCTEIGRMMLFRKIIQPACDQEKLLKQQEVIRELVNNQKLFNQINKELTNVTEPENALLAFWDSEDLFSFVVEQTKFNLPASSKVRKIKALSHWLNTSPIVIESTSLFLRAFSRTGDALAVYGLVALPVYAFTGKSIIPKLPAEDFVKLSPLTFTGGLCFMAARFGSKNIPLAITTTEYAYKNYDRAREWKTNDLFERCIHAKLQYAAHYLNTAQKLTKLITTHPSLATQFPAVKTFKNTLDNLLIKDKNPELKLLFKLLNSHSITGAYSSWFLNWGTIWVAYRLMLDHKNELLEAMQAIGEIDAQLSIAKLYKEFQNKRVQFCFPVYLENSSAPNAYVSNFWNPFVGVEQVMPSSLQLGAANQLHTNAIITGPNAGGKSTITKAFIINIVLAQSLGIAPAQALTFTPFTKIITYLNIVDDIAAANSHFKASVLRAREVVDTMHNLGSGKFGLTAIDEVFNGTTFVEGQAAAYCLFKKLGENKQSMCLTCTHFPKIPLLEEQTGAYANYKVSVIEKADGTLQYPFVLERGVSNQIITLKILRNEGFEAQFLEEAEELVANKAARPE